MKIALLLLGFLYCVNGDCQDGKPPTFGPSYSVKGILTIPYAELEEPFSAWYDSDKSRSRIDYYGDMVKTYQLSGMTEFGSSLKLAPVTTESQTNLRTCLQVNGTKENVIQPQGVLPDLSSFKCLGTEMVNGQTCEKWRFVDQVGQKISKYTMWIYWLASPKTRGLKQAVPVKYEMKGYNSLLGSHYDHYFLSYSDYSSATPTEGVFEIPNELKCTNFPGPGVDHIYDFNPMGEFVGDLGESHVRRNWEDFTDKHGKAYPEPKEHAKRMETFRQNMRYIHSMNRANLGFKLGANHLTDKSDEELRALRGKLKTTLKVGNGGKPFPYQNPRSVPVPEYIDWRLWGAVRPVKDQSVCGSCWSFGTTGAVEGAYFVATGKSVSLSEQALIDCSWGYGNNGCDGGEDFRSYQWIMKHGGLPLESEYGPYLGQDGYCHADKVKLHSPITGWVNVTPWDESALKVALFKHGPISISIDASVKTFTFYSNGVYYDPKCKNKPDELDHAVLAVGYGKLNNEPFWLVKNSWSNYWGNDGYILMSPKDNNCGVMTAPTYVTME